MPTLDVALAYVRACGGDTESWQRRWYELAADLGRPVPAGASERRPLVTIPAAEPARDQGETEVPAEQPRPAPEQILHSSRAKAMWSRVHSRRRRYR
jgi:hypothetical protein